MEMTQNQSLSRLIEQCLLPGSDLPILPSLQRSLVGLVLNSDSVGDQDTVSPHLLVVLTRPLGEAPLLGHHDDLTSGVLELGTTEGLDDGSLVLLTSAHRHDGLADVHTGNGSLSLAERSSHTSLKPISSSARQHFIDAVDVEGV